MVDRAFFGPAAEIAQLLGIPAIDRWVVLDTADADPTDLSAVIDAADIVVPSPGAHKTKVKAAALDLAEGGCRVVLIRIPDDNSIPVALARLLENRKKHKR
jgi:hypothetical protein